MRVDGFRSTDQERDVSVESIVALEREGVSRHLVRFRIDFCDRKRPS